MLSLFDLFARGQTAWKVRRWRQTVDRVLERTRELQRLSDEEHRSLSLSLRYRARSGEPLETLQIDALALASLAAQRSLGLQPYPVQILGGVALHFGAVAEMQTGEGKTLTAALGASLAALTGQGVHVATSNDYLAARDAGWSGPLFTRLGLTVGAIVQSTARTDRRAAYRCDVTYTTARELAFDFLRDRLAQRSSRENRPSSDWSRRFEGEGVDVVQRGLACAIVDEADSLLIDEARVPLVISAPTATARQEIETVRWARPAALELATPVHFLHDPREHRVELTAAGRARVRALATSAVASLTSDQLYDAVERALRVERELIRDRHYVVRDGEIVIVDEFTGRLAEGRQWRGGLHQAVEAREGVTIHPPTAPVARITVQEFFTQYRRLAGMSGTALSSAGELRTFYQRPVAVIPTHRPCRREVWPTRVFQTQSDKWAAILEETRGLHLVGRPVLIGTRSIDKSEQLAALFAAAGLPHEVLHARRLAQEAELVARAGEKCRVTIATNMAGRGTDIVLGPGVAELGGLHVIGTELHDSSRIDRQLFGRCARQGDPGSVRQFLSLEDELLEQAFGTAHAERYRTAAENRTGSLDPLSRLFRRAQRRLERQQFHERQLLVYQARARREQLAPLGYDPYLDLAED